MKFQTLLFWEKLEKNTNLSSAELAQRMVKVKKPVSLFSKIGKHIWCGLTFVFMGMLI